MASLAAGGHLHIHRGVVGAVHVHTGGGERVDRRLGEVVAEIDTDVVTRRRVVLPFFRDRRTDLYGGLSDR